MYKTKEIHAALHQNWATLWKSIDAKGDPQAVFEGLVDAYKNRPYHNLAHIGACLYELDKVRDQVSDYNALAFALWFHDVAYDSKRKDNEEKSAEWARDVGREAGLSEEFLQKVSELIIVTKHDWHKLRKCWEDVKSHSSENGKDSLFIADIDLAILGQPKKIFDEAGKRIREEYSAFSTEEYNEGRSNIFKGFLERPLIYLTPFFNEQYEATARVNLEEALKQLSLPIRTKALYAGSFDPPTNGHKWMIDSAARMFGDLVVAVGINPEKKTTFSVEERVDMLKSICRKHKNVTVTSYTNELLINYAKEIKAKYIIRGIRNPQDYVYEIAMQRFNKQIHSEIETVFLAPPPDVGIISSTLVKDLMVPNGGPEAVQRYVDPEVFAKLMAKFRK
ncbi:MAG: pantetheine-phosphate adenylyltransferase [Candidatus Micrarchaeales archaeon]|jgi:pantetheine-phosphate adenylyltransferase